MLMIAFAATLADMRLQAVLARRLREARATALAVAAWLGLAGGLGCRTAYPSDHHRRW
jgi:hypothetical protein